MIFATILHTPIPFYQNISGRVESYGTNKSTSFCSLTTSSLPRGFLLSLFLNDAGTDIKTPRVTPEPGWLIHQPDLGSGWFLTPRTKNHRRRTRNRGPRNTDQEPKTKKQGPRITNQGLRIREPIKVKRDNFLKVLPQNTSS